MFRKQLFLFSCEHITLYLIMLTHWSCLSVSHIFKLRGFFALPSATGMLCHLLSIIVQLSSKAEHRAKFFSAILEIISHLPPRALPRPSPPDSWPTLSSFLPPLPPQVTVPPPQLTVPLPLVRLIVPICRRRRPADVLPGPVPGPSYSLVHMQYS